jgi:hypothetical protein
MAIPVLMYHAALLIDAAKGARWCRSRRFARSSAGLRDAAPGLRFDEYDALSATICRARSGRDQLRRRLLVAPSRALLEEFGTTPSFVVTARCTTTGTLEGRRARDASWAELEAPRHAVSRSARTASAIGTRRRERRATPTTGASKEAIEKRFGACRHFAYPFGAHGDATVAAVQRAGYRTACTTESGQNRRGQPLLRLRRQSVSRTITAGRFRRRAGAWL